jgi:serine/threonine protein kinase
MSISDSNVRGMMNVSESAEQDLLPSFIHDRYRVESILGEDELGLVIHAVDTRLKRPVAIRSLRADPMLVQRDDYEARKDRFAQEIEAAARIGFHTNIVPILDCIVGDDGAHHLVVEYLPGGSLAARLRTGVVPVSEALRITADIATALAVAHAAGVVHRDVNPGTIFLTAVGGAKLGGFGLAQIEAQESRTRAIVLRLGTPLYMSPEQEAYLHPATDQYSLGLVLFEMVAGATYKQMTAAQAEELLRQQPSVVAALIARMVAKYPEHRFASPIEVAEACVEASQQITSREVEPNPVPEFPMDWSQEFRTNGVEGTAASYGNRALESAWGPADNPAPPVSPAPGMPDAVSAVEARDTRDPRRSRLVAELGLLLLFLCVIVGACLAHFWLGLY